MILVKGCFNVHLVGNKLQKRTILSVIKIFSDQLRTFVNKTGNGLATKSHIRLKFTNYIKAVKTFLP